MSSPFQQLRDELWTEDGPIVIFNKSHSGSRLLARVAEQGGVFIGAHLNDSKDSLDLNRLVYHLVVHHYPDFHLLWDELGRGDPDLAQLVRTVFASHFEGFDRTSNSKWGWKLGETSYIVPVIDYLFPNARFIHVIRDGRDVAFSDHHAPNTPFRKKVYFNTDRIDTWRGLKLTQWAYWRRSHIFNALHWVNSVEVGRAFGTGLGDRYMEIRYEDLCEDFEVTVRGALDFMGLGNKASKVITTLLPTVYRSAVHKYRTQPRNKLQEVLEITEPLLVSLGYLQPEGNDHTSPTPG